ncbi:MAG: PQQ-dependent sugar dehydrogenase, partial [Chitinophagales bacterium]|nr:PQQ-dependent sugar dehydrogenase [Chitinophagales bacterium]
NGGLFPGIREVPLTSAAFCISSASKNLVLPADEEGLAPFLYADGLRNTFDLAYTSDGDLLGCENSGERDDPDEINWIQKGRHYGFPWVMGGNYNPQQYPGYDPDADVMLNKNSFGYENGFFHDDPEFPPKPPGLVINAGIENYGPDADYYRDTTTGIIMQTGDLGTFLNSFTSHRSPIGLLFDYDQVLIEDFNGDGFMLGYQYEGDSAGNRPNGQTGTILDPSQDLVHLDFEKNEAGTNYKVNSTRIVGGFEKPVDACLLQNVVYVIEYSNKNNKASLWKVTLPVAASTITTADLPEEELCPGEEVTVTFFTTGIFNSGNVFTVQLSDENGSFNTPVSLGSITATSNTSFEVIIPSGSAAGDDFKMRVVSSNPPVIGSTTEEAFEIACPKPASTQTDDIMATSAKVKWEEEDCAINYQVKYRIAGNSWINVNANNDSKKLSGLSPSTNYEWKVRTKCVADPKIYSKYSPISSFTTLPLKETLINSKNNQATNHFSFYPNPAKDVTTLTFFLQEDSFLDISLLDMHCRKVKTVVAADFSEGSHQVQMDVAQFASGMYFFELRSKTLMSVRKIIIE